MDFVLGRGDLRGGLSFHLKFKSINAQKWHAIERNPGPALDAIVTDDVVQHTRDLQSQIDYLSRLPNTMMRIRGYVYQDPTLANVNSRSMVSCINSLESDIQCLVHELTMLQKQLKLALKKVRDNLNSNAI